MRVLSWNVNGLRSAAQKGLGEKIKQFDADIIGLQEIRAQPDQIMPLVDDFPGYYLYFSSGVRPGYSGVALFCRTKPKELISQLDIPHFDAEGRFQIAIFDNFCVVNAYFPNGSGKDGDNSRVPFKLEFSHAVLDYLAKIKLPKLVMGDFNTAHQAIDLARPSANINSSGFLPEEREHFSYFLAQGYVDTFRDKQPDPGHYTWWSNRSGARQKNIGWRIDYVLACHQAHSHVKNAFIWPHISGSDHCPVGVDIDFGAHVLSSDEVPNKL